MTSAVVVGASVAGLLTARVLSDVVDEVVVLERERLTDTASPRGRVPQGKHLHLLLTAGLDRLVAWFPGIEVELEELGAVRIDGTRAWVYQAGGYRAQGDWGRPVLSMTRPLLEQVVRHRIALLGNVRLEDGVVVDRLEVSEGRVSGVLVDGVAHRGDLVVDCSGRSSRIAHQLEASGVLAPPVSRVLIDCAYSSGFIPRSADDFEGAFLVCGTSPPTSFRAGAVLPVEGHRWMVTLAGVHGDVPRHDRGRGPRVRSQSTVAGGGAVRRARRPAVVGGVVPLPVRANAGNYEKVGRLPPGFVTLGDAVVQLRPDLRAGHGVRRPPGRRARGNGARGGGAFGGAATAVPSQGREDHRRSLAIAVGADFLHPRTVCPKARGTDLANRYVMRIIKASHTSVPAREVVQPRGQPGRDEQLAGAPIGGGPGPPRRPGGAAKPRSAIRESGRRVPLHRARGNHAGSTIGRWDQPGSRPEALPPGVARLAAARSTT